MQATQQHQPARTHVEIPASALPLLSSGKLPLIVSPALTPGDIDLEHSTHRCGTGVVARDTWTWDPNQADQFTAAVAEPWKLPGTRLIGGFSTEEYHECGDVPAVDIFLFVNRTDFVVA